MTTTTRNHMLCTIIVARYEATGNEAGKYKKNVLEGHFDGMVCEQHEEMMERYESQHQGEFVNTAHNGNFADSAHHAGVTELAHHGDEKIHNLITPHHKPNDDFHHGNTPYEPSFKELHSSTGQTYHDEAHVEYIGNAHLKNDHSEDHHYHTTPIKPAPRPVFDMSHHAVVSNTHNAGHVAHPVPVSEHGGQQLVSREG